MSKLVLDGKVIWENPPGIEGFFGIKLRKQIYEEKLCKKVDRRIKRKRRGTKKKEIGSALQARADQEMVRGDNNADADSEDNAYRRFHWLPFNTFAFFPDEVALSVADAACGSHGGSPWLDYLCSYRRIYSNGRRGGFNSSCHRGFYNKRDSSLCCMAGRAASRRAE